MSKGLLLKNGEVFREDGNFEKTDVRVANGIIEALGDSAPVFGNDAYESIDVSDKYIIPGLIDIHLHGSGGSDFCDGNSEALQTIAKYALRNGITGILPTSMTFDEERLSKIFKNVVNFEYADGADILGINMEGPFLNPGKCGAQNPEFLANPDVGMFERLQNVSGGRIKIVCVAPELPGAMDFIGSVSSKVHVSLAHTNVDYETASKAFESGADHVTHLYNAMTAFNHRKSGVIGATFDNDSSFVEIIGDGIHVSAPAFRMALKCIGDDRMVLISDSIRATGLPDGEYELGGQKVLVSGHRCTLENGTIAGSNTNLMECLRTVVRKMNIEFGRAVKMATVNPAKAIGEFERRGSIESGKKADLVILNRDMKLVRVIKNGQMM